MRFANYIDISKEISMVEWLCVMLTRSKDFHKEPISP